MRLDVADVRDALVPEQVINHYGLQAKRRGSQFRLQQCPRCQEKSQREAIAIDAKSGHWLHHGHERAAGGECSGDLIDLVAACEQLSTKSQFSQVLEIAAQIAGVTHVSDVERDLRRAQAQESARLEALRDAQSMIDARDTAGLAWSELARRDLKGEQYLVSRGLDAHELVVRDAVRFSPIGVVVAIRDADGFPTSTATRRYVGEPKVLALKAHSTRGTMIDSLADIVHSKPVVLVEGVADALTARLAWPDATILGANGAGNLPKIAEQAIMRIKLASTSLLLVPHDDDPGIRAATEAGRIAIAAGLELEQQLFVVALPAKDLNAAWSQGWRP
jgi:hypothetical protein